jgi:hypothetical protein
MPREQRKMQDSTPPRPRTLAEIDGGRARLGLAVIAACSLFWIAVVWACLRFF